ncbi:snf1 kinase complex beta-subunit [Colletotrichum truncatum]|uniref:Snf1 kinase complex beta-subunit n=1 Tax=Colletotrichum truncatum TaxID=5467 RepID=A0ACC3ZIZ0_COLTU|nr:snf1 kinase complex beta-subunit [Colletotrichum truncatum]KAF6791934.1 snf1 kinase complex beta-subunit [Colletotrichum truncatum]
MGNNPSSSSKPATPVSSASASQDSPKHHHHHHKRESRHNIPPRSAERVAAPPEPSLTQAQGSTITKGPKPLQSIPISNFTTGSPSSSSSTSVPQPKPPDSKHIIRDEPSKPVDVPSAPTESSSLRSHYSAHMVEPPLVSNNSVNDMSYITRPPRLPLPIEEEIHTPGSPIIAPADAGEVAVADVENLDSDGMTRKSSALSTNTVDEEDGEELIVDKTRPTVPTRLEWRRGGGKIYVTGTIFQWNRKQRLHPVEGQPGVFAATIHILPGTHHVRFLVDGIMQTSPDLPTTVDFGNNLVNFIEVSADDLPAKAPVTPGPVPAPGTVANDQGALKASASQGDEQPKPPRGKAVPSPSQYFHQIPKYLVDFDQPEDSPAYQYAVTAIEKLPTPPSLPGFLGKPILNAAVLMKDDNSVLNMPNHTVLNHLATSSIKNNILAVSATTRYKNKYVTTIIYKPTTTDE